jgi:hypothetical protein
MYKSFFFFFFNFFKINFNFNFNIKKKKKIKCYKLYLKIILINKFLKINFFETFLCSKKKFSVILILNF